MSFFTKPTAPARPAIILGLRAKLPEDKIARALGVSREYVAAVRRESNLPKPPASFAQRVRRGKVNLGAVYLSSVVTRVPDDALDALARAIPPGATLADHMVQLMTDAGNKAKGMGE